jgi:lysophospholipase L1-like esterase
MKSLYILSDSTGVGQFVPLHKTWAVMLSEYLEGRYIVQNLSRNGETSRQALERIVPDVLRYEPNIVYVQYGTNDANKWETDRGLPRVMPEEFTQNMTSIVKRCWQFGAKVILGSNHTGAYNHILGLAHSVNYLVEHNYIDCTMPDGIHLNERGHKLYFESIAKVIP